MAKGDAEHHFRNRSGEGLYIAVHHAGCGGTPWRGGRPKCWTQDPLKNDQNAVYVPDAWVTGFDKWLDIILGVGAIALDVAVIVATEGAAAPVVAEEMGIELTDLAAEAGPALEQAASASRVARVAAAMGMSAKALQVTAAAVGGGVACATGAAINEIFANDWGIYVGRSGDTAWTGAETDLYKPQFVFYRKEKSVDKYYWDIEAGFHKNKDRWAPN